MRKIIILLLVTLYAVFAVAQSVGIGTSNPNPSAALDVVSTSKGILFPRLTTVQRNAITNPPDGLHVYNTDDHCLNYYDSSNKIWNCLCSSCQTVVINISSNACKIDFYESYAKGMMGKKYLINISAGVTIGGCASGDTALSFVSMPFTADITINNNGTISGAGGVGGQGTIESQCGAIPFPFAATPGGPGGFAVATKSGITVTINNAGMVAGGGGGGGGSGSGQNEAGYGGGGGGGAGIAGGNGGIGGGGGQGGLGACIVFQGLAANGSTGGAFLGGNGGPGKAGGATGGNGGNSAQVGQPGSGNLAAAGGQPGKAIGGGSGNKINNINAGQSFGNVD